MRVTTALLVRLARGRSISLLGLCAAAALMLAGSVAQAGSAITVSNTHDSGVGSLRQAILDANSGGPGNMIVFNIPGTDPGFNGQWFTIAPLSPLPVLAADGTTIDGASQTAFTGNTNLLGPEIFLDGRSMTFSSSGSPGGLWIQSSSTTVDGLTVSGFVGQEIVIDGGARDVLRGDYVGTDPTGTASIPAPADARAFEDDGIWVVDSATDALIGGTTAADRNVISGNEGTGILVSSPDNRVVIEGNYIGTNATGTAGLGDGGGGVTATPYAEWADEPGPTNVVIGGAAPGTGNLISGTGADAVFLGTTGATVQGNLIGIDAGGNYAIPNAGSGVSLANASDTLIGGTTAAARNVISGNGGGVSVSDGCSGDVIAGNYIGTTAAGTARLGNATNGIGIDGTAANTIVGGTAPGAGNVISANGVAGVDLLGGRPSMPVGTIIQGNLIGTDATGTYALGNAAAGIGFDRPAPDTVVGGSAPGAGNVISGNQVGINGEAAGTTVQGNEIGTNRAGAAVPNTLAGLVLSGGGTLIKANTIADNGGVGIAIVSPTGGSFTGDTISRNSIFSNGGLGIDLSWDGVTPNDPGDVDAGPNNLQNFPVLNSAFLTSGQLVVDGMIDTPNPQSVTLEFFGNAIPVPGGDPSGYGEGATFLGTVTPAANGTFSVAVPSVAPGTLISATATDAAGDTSEFAQDIAAATLTPTALCALTRQDVDSSSKYGQLKPVARKVTDALVTAACQVLTNVGPKLRPADKAKFITAYQRAVQALVPSGWLTQPQADVLKRLAGQL